MRGNYVKRFLVLGIFLFSSCTVPGSTPFTGTWKMNLDQSRFETKPIVVSLKNGWYDCFSCVPKVHIKADGNDQPIAGLPHDTLAVKEIDSDTVKHVFKQDGKIVSEQLMTAAENGRLLHNKTTRYPSLPGKPIVSEGTLQRVGDPIPGANATSGSWRTKKVDSERPLVAIFKETDTGLSASGASGNLWIANFDGKDYPVRGIYGTNSVALRKIDSHTIEMTFKDSVQVTRVDTLTVSADGKTITSVSQSKLSGRTNTWVLTKQEK